MVSVHQKHAGKDKEAARLYTEEQTHLPSIAQIINVPLGTVRNWYNAAKGTSDDWDEARASFEITRTGTQDIIARTLFGIASGQQAFEDQKRSILAKIEMSEEMSADERLKRLALLQSLENAASDSLSKKVAALDKLRKNPDPKAVRVELLRQLGFYVRASFPGLWVTISPVLAGFAVAKWTDTASDASAPVAEAKETMSAEKLRELMREIYGV